MSTAPSMPQSEAASGDLGDLVNVMKAKNLRPLWELYKDLVTGEPRPGEPTAKWTWRELRPLAERAGTVVKGAAADHRVLLLTNAALQPGPPRTTIRLVAGVQCVMPGERTVEHRHTAAAVRLILEANGAITYVDGRECPMYDFDFIITPNWTWHGHNNPSGEHAIWLDVLDVPLTGQLNTMFGQEGPPNGYPEHMDRFGAEPFAGSGLAPLTGQPAVPYSMQFRYPWADAAKALKQARADGDGARRLRYINPMTGGSIMPTMDATLLDISPGRSTRLERSTATAICVVLSGSGSSSIGSVSQPWSARDIFTRPNWQWTSHTAGADGAQLLFVSDSVAVERLGMLREEVRAA